MREAAVDRFGRAVAGAGPLEVGQDVGSSPGEGPAERDQLAQRSRHVLPIASMTFASAAFSAAMR